MSKVLFQTVKNQGENCHTALSWISAIADNLASLNLQYRATEWHYYRYLTTPPISNIACLTQTSPKEIPFKSKEWHYFFMEPAKL